MVSRPSRGSPTRMVPRATMSQGKHSPLFSKTHANASLSLAETREPPASPSARCRQRCPTPRPWPSAIGRAMHQPTGAGRHAQNARPRTFGGRPGGRPGRDWPTGRSMVDGSCRPVFLAVQRLPLHSAGTSLAGAMLGFRNAYPSPSSNSCRQSTSKGAPLKPLWPNHRHSGP